MDLFIGPCVLENEKLAMDIARSVTQDLKGVQDRLNIVFKGSFDKANRTSIDSFRGPGIDEGLRIFEKIKSEFGLQTLADFHYPEQAETVAEVVDYLQVPAFLCRQTDMIISGAKACLKHDCSLKVKKGQFLSPEETSKIVEKASSIISKDRILLTERGTSFGYNNLVVDMSSFQIMKGFGVKVIHDATHCVQRPGGLGNITGGKREQIAVLAQAAIAAGADGIFVETHPTPEKALSDSATCMDLKLIKPFVEKLLKIFSAVNEE